VPQPNKEHVPEVPPLQLVLPQEPEVLLQHDVPQQPVALPQHMFVWQQPFAEPQPNKEQYPEAAETFK